MPIKPKNIFDLTDIKDLPNDIIEFIGRPPKPMSVADKILSLFEIKSELTISEIMVGLFRKYNISKNEGNLSSILFYLCQKNKLEKIKTHVYKLKNDHD